MSKSVDDKKFGSHYLESFKQAVVAEIELELNIGLVCARHDLSRDTVRAWLKRYASSSYHQCKVKRMSLLERGKVARDIVSGHLSIADSSLKYRVSPSTVTSWLREYKVNQELTLNLLPPVTPISITDPVMSADLRLAELKIRALEMMLDLASNEFKVDIRKKFGAKQ